MKDRLSSLAAALLGLVLIVGSVWVWTSAPCGLWSYSKAGDMPARCINR
ncbi:hypothetical protein AB0D08_00355 [Kitasatospora sp. NPDC048540]